MSRNATPSTGLSPSLTCRSRSTSEQRKRDYGRLWRPQFAGDVAGDWMLELFPLRSPLLGESRLVSLPPLINMLKFGG